MRRGAAALTSSRVHVRTRCAGTSERAAPRRRQTRPGDAAPPAHGMSWRRGAAWSWQDWGEEEWSGDAGSATAWRGAESLPEDGPSWQDRANAGSDPGWSGRGRQGWSTPAGAERTPLQSQTAGSFWEDWRTTAEGVVAAVAWTDTRRQGTERPLPRSDRAAGRVEQGQAWQSGQPSWQSGQPSSSSGGVTPVRQAAAGRQSPRPGSRSGSRSGARTRSGRAAAAQPSGELPIRSEPPVMPGRVKHQLPAGDHVPLGMGFASIPVPWSVKDFPPTFWKDWRVKALSEYGCKISHRAARSSRWRDAPALVPRCPNIFTVQGGRCAECVGDFFASLASVGYDVTNLDNANEEEAQVVYKVECHDRVAIDVGLQAPPAPAGSDVRLPCRWVIRPTRATGATSPAEDFCDETKVAPAAAASSGVGGVPPTAAASSGVGGVPPAAAASRAAQAEPPAADVAAGGVSPDAEEDGAEDAEGRHRLKYSVADALTKTAARVLSAGSAAQRPIERCVRHAYT